MVERAAARDVQQEAPPAPADDGEGVQISTSDSSDEQSHYGGLETSTRVSSEDPEQRATTLAALPGSAPTLDALALKDAELQQLQRTHDEYVKSSCEYEKELESELERCEKKALALEQSVRASEAARDQLSSKLGEAQTQLEATTQRERTLLLELEEMKWKIQRLEQANDELETAARIAQASIEDLEHKNETLLEQNVFLAQEKEEVSRQLASITVAEVHPVVSVGGGTTLTLASGSSLMNMLPLHRQHSENAVSTSAGGGAKQQQRGKAPRLKSRYPDVVESCIHITCQKCRAGSASSSSRSRPPHRHLGLSHHGHQSRQHRRSSAASSSFEVVDGAKKRAAPSSVFERMRLRFRSLFNCSDEKQAVSVPVGAASAPKS